MNFLENLDKDVFFPFENRYRLLRCEYIKYNYVENGKPITERVFSFGLVHGKEKYNNSTYRNFKESELDTVIDKYKEMLVEIRTERRNKLLRERAERKMFPTLDTYKFDNVTIDVVQEYEYEGHKKYKIYANKMPYRSGYGVVDIDKVIDFNYVLNFILKGVVAKYNVYPLDKATYKRKTSKRIKHAFLPYHFYLGYVIEHEGKQYVVNDVRHSWITDSYEFVTNQKENIPLALTDYNKIKVIGEAQGMEAWVALMNKLKYVE